MNGDGNEMQPAPPEDEAALEARRRALAAELQSLRPPDDTAAEAAREAGRGGWGRGARLASDFVAGVLLGGAIGWFIDRLLGSSPWGLIICLLFGFAAGTLTALRSAGMVRENEALRRDGG